MHHQFKPGKTLAYYETISSGLVPCRIISAIHRPYHGYDFTIEITAQRRCYERGEQIHNCASLHIIPRDAVKRHKYSTTILPFAWELAQ